MNEQGIVIPLFYSHANVEYILKNQAKHQIILGTNKFNPVMNKRTIQIYRWKLHSLLCLQRNILVYTVSTYFIIAIGTLLLCSVLEQ
jgi:hypothetical protein